MTRSCARCAFAAEQGTPLLSCRRRAPLAEERGKRLGGVSLPVWPDVEPSDWCGEWVPSARAWQKTIRALRVEPSR